MKVKNRDYFFDHTSKDLTDYHSRRRSLYLPIVRNNLFDLFQLLDYPDAAVPSGDRAVTTVAPQALMMLNSDFVMESSAEFAARVLAGPGDDDRRLARIYALAYGREITADELRANRAFLAKVGQLLARTEPAADRRRRQAWAVLCQTVVASNEFVYVK